MQDCSLNGIAFIQIAPNFLILSEFTLCTNLPSLLYQCLLTVDGHECTGRVDYRAASVSGSALVGPGISILKGLVLERQTQLLPFLTIFIISPARMF